VRSQKKNRALAGGFLAGSFSIFLSGLLLALALAFSGKQFLPAALVVAGAHVPIMLMEGILTAACVGFLRKVKPGLLDYRPIVLSGKVKGGQGT